MPSSGSSITIQAVPVARGVKQWSLESRTVSGLDVPLRIWAETLADASQETRFQLVFHLAPSQVVLAQLLAMEQELRQLPREEVIQLARQAKGSWKSTEADAVAIVRKLRDEWDSDAS